MTVARDSNGRPTNRVRVMVSNRPRRADRKLENKYSLQRVRRPHHLYSSAEMTNLHITPRSVVKAVATSAWMNSASDVIKRFMLERNNLSDHTASRSACQLDSWLLCLLSVTGEWCCGLTPFDQCLLCSSSNSISSSHITLMMRTSIITRAFVCESDVFFR